MGALLAIATSILAFASLQALWLMWRARYISLPEPLPGDRDLAAVSVLIPCFNEERVLEATVASVLNSSNVRIARIICIDDGSTDRTAEVIHRLQRQYGEVVKCLRQANAGKAAALNHGLAHVTTASFACIDADTQLLATTLHNLACAFSERGVVAVSGHLAVGDRAQRPGLLHLGQLLEYATANHIERRALTTLKMTPVVPGPIGLFSTEAVRHLGGYSKDTLAEDKDLTLALLSSGQTVRYAPEAWALTEAPATLHLLYRQRLRWATGKWQVLIKHRAALLERASKARWIWLFNFFNESFMPLFSLPLQASVGIYAAQGLLQAGRHPGWWACMLVLLFEQGVHYARYRTSFDDEARGRLKSGLAIPARSIHGLLPIYLVRFAATWHGLLRCLARRPQRWDKLPRQADVVLPHIAKPLQHPADISDIKQ